MKYRQYDSFTMGDQVAINLASPIIGTLVSGKRDAQEMSWNYEIQFHQNMPNEVINSRRIFHVLKEVFMIGSSITIAISGDDEFQLLDSNFTQAYEQYSDGYLSLGPLDHDQKQELILNGYGAIAFHASPTGYIDPFGRICVLRSNSSCN